MGKKIAIIGGAGGLIGEQIAKDFAAQGHLVLGLDKEFKQEMSFRAQVIDLTDEEAVQEFFSSNLGNEKFDQCVLINCQGIADPYTGKLEDLSFDRWSQYVNVNLNSFFLTSREFLRHKEKFKEGRIINLSSTRHLMAEKDTEAYCASKGAILSFTQALAVSCSNENITVNCISPGWIDNPDKNFSQKAHQQHPSGRVGVPSDISKACLYLAHTESGFVTGQDFVIDGGMTRKMIYKS